LIKWFENHFIAGWYPAPPMAAEIVLHGISRRHRRHAADQRHKKTVNPFY